MRERLLGAVLVFALLAGTAMGPGVAGDDSILLYPGEEQRTVEPGDEIDIELVVSHHGGPYGEGLERVTVVGEYEPSRLRVSDISTAGWIASRY